ncbi:hypothetical protein BJX99DRAFT_228232 [Aspergillus californicus]
MFPSGLTPRDNLNVSDSTLPTASPSASSSRSSRSSSSSSSSPGESSNSSDRATKRKLNTLAARRYRQRRVDRTRELEAELDAVKQERDVLRMRVSKLEGETNALNGLLEIHNSKSSHSRCLGYLSAASALG